MELVSILFILAVVWLVGLIFERINQPAILGELLAGLVIGPPVLNLVGFSPTIEVLASLGMFFLMFYAGLQTDLKKFVGTSRLFLGVGIGGTIFPLLLGMAVTIFFGGTVNQALLVGIAISGTALAVKVKILTDLNLIRSKVGYIMMGASVTDNILSFIILAAILKAITVGVTLLDIGISVFEVAAFFAAVLIMGYFVYPKINKLIRGEMRVFVFALVLGFFFAAVGEQLGIHFIIGAYLAGLFVREELSEQEFKKVNTRFETLSYGFFAPIFIVSVAFHISLGVFMTGLPFLIALTSAAVIGKLIGAGGGGYLTGLRKDEAITIGIGMNARGMVELILALVGFELGILTETHLTLLVAVAFITTLMTPAWLRYRLIKRKQR